MNISLCKCDHSFFVRFIWGHWLCFGKEWKVGYNNVLGLRSWLLFPNRQLDVANRVHSRETICELVKKRASFKAWMLT